MDASMSYRRGHAPFHLQHPLQHPPQHSLQHPFQHPLSTPSAPEHPFQQPQHTTAPPSHPHRLRSPPACRSRPPAAWPTSPTHPPKTHQASTRTHNPIGDKSRRRPAQTRRRAWRPARPLTGRRKTSPRTDLGSAGGTGYRAGQPGLAFASPVSEPGGRVTRRAWTVCVPCRLFTP